MQETPDRIYFFIHVMKTAGWTFNKYVRSRFRPEEIYPTRGIEENNRRAYTDIATLLTLPAERRRQVRFYHGHFPYMVVEELGIELTTMTLLRDPVTRTISRLKQALRTSPHFRDSSLEDVYENPFFGPWFIRNHQAKIFSLEREDDPESFMQDITVDERRLEIAKQNLAAVDLFGLTEDLPAFLGALADDYGWTIGKHAPVNVGKDGPEASQALVDRIREENAMDIAFYDYAVSLLHERRRADGPRR